MKILHLEDNPRDAELVRDVLEADWPVCDIVVVASRDAFLSALAEDGFDLVLSDYKLPGFDGLEALGLARARAPHIPFIFFSGTLGEDRAIEAVRAGAADYVIKDRMGRLPVAVQRVLREAEERRERRRVEEALAQEQYLLLMLMENLPEFVYFKDAHSRFISFSRSVARRHGLSAAALKGKTDFDLFSEEHARRAAEDEQRILRTGEPLIDVEEKEIWPDGRVTWVLTTKLPLRDEAGKISGTFGISRDITARKRADEHIRDQAEIIDQAPIAILVTDLAHRITYCNAGAVELYGQPRATLLGGSLAEIFAADSLRRIEEGRKATGVSGRWTGDVSLTTQAGRSLQIEFHMSPIYDAAGQPRAQLSIAVDITENKKLEQQFLRAQRLESLGMLAAGIAHDLNNILAPVLMGAPLLRSRASHPSDLRLLATIEKSAGRGAALVRQILSFVHGASGERTLIQIKHLVHDIGSLIQETFPKNIQLDERLPNELWPILGNPTQLHQVLLNLCVNARDAMPHGGRLRIRAENRVLTGPMAQAYPDANPGSYLMIEVSDTGAGIAPEILAHIWDPFFTTKAEGKGTGLGLVTVRGIAANHGGFATVESVPGRGTSFGVFLPAAEASLAAGPSADAPSSLPAPGRRELVLVVDDEASIRDTVAAVLNRAGYRVVTAANGIEAMTLYAPRAAEVALIITDLSMPEMGGGELALALSRLNPAVNLLCMSGADGEGGMGEVAPASAGFLRKPFSVERLLAAVHERLDAPPLPAQ